MRFWAVKGQSPSDPVPVRSENVLAVALSPDGRTVATAGGWDFAARLWNAETGKLLAQTLPHRDRVSALAMSPNGRTLLTGSWDTTARLWDALTGKPLATRPLPHKGLVVGAAFSPDSETVLTAMENRVERKGAAQFWNVATGEPLGNPIPLPGEIGAVVFTPEGDGLVVVAGKVLELRRPLTGRDMEGEAVRAMAPVLEPVIALSRDGGTALTKTGRLLNVSSEKLLGPALFPGEQIMAAAFDSTGEKLLTATKQGLRLWRLETLKCDPERVSLWTQVITGQELDEFGRANPLDLSKWTQRRDRLNELGGSPRP